MKNKLLSMKKLLLLACFALFLTIPLAKAQNSFNGKILSTSISPQQIYINQEMHYTVNMQNTGDQSNGYTMIISFAENGIVSKRIQLSFSVDSGKGFSTTTSFTPTMIGTYTIVTRLMDQYSTTIYDFKTEDIKVVSDVGPFDISIQPIAKTVSSGQLTPFILDLKNMGQQSLDAQLNVVVDCLAIPDITSTSVIFIKNESEAFQTIQLPVCQEEGLHTVSASMIIFNRTWVSSTNQFFINSTTSQIAISSLPNVKVQSGNSIRFSIQLTNPNSFGLYNLKASVSGVPSDWLDIQPQEIPYLEPQGKGLFLVEVSPPTNAAPQNYPLTVYVGSDTGLVSDVSALTVLAGPGISPASTTVVGSVQNLVLQNYYLIIAIFVVALVIVAIRKLRRQTRYTYNSSLSRIRDSLR